MAAPIPPTLEIVAHCWNYWRLLCFHLSAYVIAPPRVPVVVTICHAPAADDPRTAAVLRYFEAHQPPNVTWNWLEIPPRQLFRRAIGRNLAAGRTQADYVLFGDVDYLFAPGALDAIAAELAARNDRNAIFFPRHIMQSREQSGGDAEIERVAEPSIAEVNRRLLGPARLRTAIGGAQWVSGDFCRRRGYLSDSRLFMREARSWQRTKCDVAFRRWAGLRIVPLEVPGVWRIRHSKRGRTDEGVIL